MTTTFRRILTYCALVSGLMLTAANAAAVPSAGLEFDRLIGKTKASMQVDPRAAIATGKQAEALAVEERDLHKRQLMRATANWLIGEAYLRIDEIDQAEPLIRSSLSVASKLAPMSLIQADLFLSLGGIATERGDVASALSDYQQAHQIYRRLGETRGQTKALIQIASLHYLGNDWRGALRYHAEALEAYDADPGLSFSIHNGRGNALKELGNTSQAKLEFALAKQLAEGMKSPFLSATVLNNVARMELSIGNLKQADVAIAESIRTTGGDTPPEFRNQQLALAAEAAYQHHEYARAATLIEQAFQGVDLTATTLADREAHRTAYLTYQKLHRDDLALVHLRALKRLDDDATTLARSTSAALMGARFDFANQALKIANLKAEDAQKSAAFERSRAQTERWVFMGAAVATMIVIAMLLFALRTSRRARANVQAANDDLAVTNSALGKALAAKTEFLATTSHEIRTPLNGILGMTQVMLVDRSLAPGTRDRLSIVHEAGVTMKALVDDILDVAKMETGNLTVEDSAFDLRAMIVAASELWEAQARAKGLDFVRDLDACPGQVRGDGARVRQVLFNLLSNAIKFTPDGHVGIAVSRMPDGRCRLAVTDSGIGIAPDKIDTIFESFRQADTSTTRRFGGTGLGLTISRNLARAMGGDVHVDSVEGKGTRFSVDLALPPVEAAGSIGCGEDDAAVDLLIVDPNPIARAMLKSLLAPLHPCIVMTDTIENAIDQTTRRDVRKLLVEGSALDRGAIVDELTQLISATRAPVTLLWPAAETAPIPALENIGLDDIILKPIAGTMLVQRLAESRGSPVSAPLVSQAA